MPQRLFAAAAEALPVAWHGVISGSSKLRTSFTGKAGQPILFEVEAQRLGGKLRPVLHLYDADDKHLAWSLPSPVLRGDTRLEVKLPADGKYTLELHDLQYAAPAPNYFRLKIGTWQFADLVFPPAVERGKAATLELIGNVPAGKRVNFPARTEKRSRRFFTFGMRPLCAKVHSLPHSSRTNRLWSQRTFLEIDGWRKDF